MKKCVRKTGLTMAMAAAAIAFSACSSDKTFDSSIAENAQKTQYADNFVNKYGAINPNQSWDFTTGEQLGTRGVTSPVIEVVAGIDFGITNNEITKNQSIYDAISKVLPEKKTQKCNAAVLAAPSSDFYIFPVTTGGRYIYNLMVKVGDAEPVQLYKKNWEMDYKTYKPYVNGMHKDDVDVVMNGVHIQAPVGAPIQIYLDSLWGKEKYEGYMEPLGTTTGHAYYVDVPENTLLDMGDIQLRDGYVIKYIGIEDCNIKGRTDNDCNDVVLAVVGNPDIPREVIITEDTYSVETNITKRYLIEDLGSIDDFDFNDVVVDVTQNMVTSHKVTKENNVIVTDEITGTETSQKAVVRAMGGTLDFTLTIGNTTWQKSVADNAKFNVKTMYNTEKGKVDYDAELATFDVTGWDPYENNVNCAVNQNNGAVYTVTFPKKGTAPMIIAVDPTQKWMDERVSIPSGWFTAE